MPRLRMPRPVRVEIIRGHDGDYYWRAVAGNHRVVGASEEGCFSKWYCKRKARKVWPQAEIVDKT